jgi:hypothetical protein
MQRITFFSLIFIKRVDQEFKCRTSMIARDQPHYDVVYWHIVLKSDAPHLARKGVGWSPNLQV